MMAKISFVLCVISFCCVPLEAQYSVQRVISFSTAADSTATYEVGTATQFRQLVWQITGGTLSACTVRFGQSADGSSWSALGSNNTCTSNGSGALVSGTPNYVRVEVVAPFTAASGTPILTATYTGYRNTVDAGDEIVVSTLTVDTMTNTAVPYIGPGGLFSENPSNLFWTNGSTLLTANNLTVPGNTTLSGLSAGSLLFCGVGCLVSQDNMNLFWDNAAKRLRIGPIGPVATESLTVSGGVDPLTIFRDVNANGSGMGLTFAMDNSGGTPTEYARIRAAIVSNTAGMENSRIQLRTKNAGTEATRVTVEDTIDGFTFGAARDTNIYRSAADTLKTDDRLVQANFATFANQDATPTIAAGNLFKTANTIATTVTAFDDDVNGQQFCIIFGDALTTITDGGTIFLQGAGNFTSTADDVLCLLSDGTNNYEMSRSVN